MYTKYIIDIYRKWNIHNAYIYCIRNYVIILCYHDISWCFLQHCFGLHDASRHAPSASRQHGYTALLELKQRQVYSILLTSSYCEPYSLWPSTKLDFRTSKKSHSAIHCRIFQSSMDSILNMTIWNLLEYRSWDPLHHGDLKKSPINAKLWAPARIPLSLIYDAWIYFRYLKDEKSVILWHIMLQPLKLSSIASRQISIQPSISLLPSRKFHPSVAARVEVEISAPRAEHKLNIIK